MLHDIQHSPGHCLSFFHFQLLPVFFSGLFTVTAGVFELLQSVPVSAAALLSVFFTEIFLS